MKRKRGRPTKRAAAQDIKTIKSVVALQNNSTIAAAYREVHPNCTDATAKKHAKNMLTIEVVAAFKEAMDLNNFATATKGVLEKVLFSVVARWYAGAESTSNLIAAVRELTKIVPGWEDKLRLTEESSEEEVDSQLKELGLDPTQYENGRN